jgi:hypothetical protein
MLASCLSRRLKHLSWATGLRSQDLHWLRYPWPLVQVPLTPEDRHTFVQLPGCSSGNLPLHLSAPLLFPTRQFIGPDQTRPREHGTERYLHPSSLKNRRSSAFFSPSPRFIPHQTYYRVRHLFWAFNLFCTSTTHDTAPHASGQPTLLLGYYRDQH